MFRMAEADQVVSEFSYGTRRSIVIVLSPAPGVTCAGFARSARHVPQRRAARAPSRVLESPPSLHREEEQMRRITDAFRRWRQRRRDKIVKDFSEKEQFAGQNQSSRYQNDIGRF
jgi:hypothetical protein